MREGLIEIFGLQPAVTDAAILDCARTQAKRVDHLVHHLVVLREMLANDEIQRARDYVATALYVEDGGGQ